MYQYDAACWVIARLTKEWDQARENLSLTASEIRARGMPEVPTEAEDNKEPQNAFTEDEIWIIEEKSAETMKKRKELQKVQVPPTHDQIKAYTQQFIMPLHSDEPAGINAFD